MNMKAARSREGAVALLVCAPTDDLVCSEAEAAQGVVLRLTLTLMTWFAARPRLRRVWFFA